MSLNDIPEHIWIEMILSDLRFELYVPEAKKTNKIKAAYQWRKQGDVTRVRQYEASEDADLAKKLDVEFTNILAGMDKNGSSEEHKHWRTIAIAAIKNK